MAFLEQIGKRIADAGQNVAHRTKNLADVALLNNAISGKEKKISQLFLAIGQSYYEKHKDDNTADELDEIKEIKTLYAEIQQNREKIKIISNQTEEGTSPINADSNTKNRKVGIITVAGMAVVLMIAAISLFGGRSYKATVEQYLNAQFEVDSETILKLLPKEMLAFVLESEGYDEKEQDQLIDKLNETIQVQVDSFERYFGEDWKVSFEILDTQDVSGGELEALKKDYGDINVKVSAAKTVSVRFTVTADEKKNSNTMDVSVIKVGRSWYLDMESMGNIF